MDEKVKLAVSLALDGMGVRQAWTEAGKPNGEARLQNIRKHKRDILKKNAAAGALASAPVTPEPPVLSSSTTAGSPSDVTAPAVTTAGAKRARELKPMRRNSKQVDRQESIDAALKRAFVDALKAASLEYKAALMTGRTHGASISADTLAENYNETLGADVKRLQGWRIRRHVDNGMAGLSPVKKGPPPVIPNCIVSLMATAWRPTRQWHSSTATSRSPRRSSATRVRSSRTRSSLRPLERILTRASIGRHKDHGLVDERLGVVVAHRPSSFRQWR